MKMHKPILCKADKVRGIKTFNVFFSLQIQIGTFFRGQEPNSRCMCIYIKLTDSGRCGYKNPTA